VKRQKEKEAERKRIEKQIEDERAARRDAEKKRKADELAQQLADDRQAELDAERAAEEAQKKAAHEAMLKQLESDAEFEAQEKKIRAAERERATASLFARYQGLIIDKVTANFNPPPGSSTTLSALVEFRLDNDGNLVTGKVTRSSGNFAFDRACEVAIQKSAPFPMPTQDPEAMRRLSHIEFEMKSNLGR